MLTRPTIYSRPTRAITEPLAVSHEELDRVLRTLRSVSDTILSGRARGSDDEVSGVAACEPDRR